MNDVQKSNGTPRRGNAGTSSPSKTNEASALVIILFLLTIILIIVIAFASSMRLEGMAAHNNNQGQRADLVMQSAIAHAVSLLANNIPDPDDPTADPLTSGTKTTGTTGLTGPVNWYTNPGQLTLIDASNPPRITHIPLYTGTASAADTTVAVNLNAASPTTLKYPITGGTDQMWVSWVSVLQDSTAPASASNPMIGRYAFWMDDESSKLNFNVGMGKPDLSSGTAGVLLPAGTAWRSTADLSPLSPTFVIGSGTYALGEPESINLDTLGNGGTPIINVSKLHSDTTASGMGFFKTPEAIKTYIINGVADTVYEQNKFNLTAFSRSPEFNVFGKPRIFMAKLPTDLASSPTYQHATIKEQPTIFYGENATMPTSSTIAVSASNMEPLRSPAAAALSKYLYRTDWPGYGGKKFRWVTNAATPDDAKAEADQVGINIENMGFWAATPASDGHLMSNAMNRWANIVGEYTPVTSPNNYLWKGPNSQRPIVPNYPGPAMTEIGVQVIPEMTGSNSTNFWLKFQITGEFYQPPFHVGTPLDTTATPPTAAGFVNFGGNSAGYYMNMKVTSCQITVSGTPVAPVTSPVNNAFLLVGAAKKLDSNGNYILDSSGNTQSTNSTYDSVCTSQDQAISPLSFTSPLPQDDYSVRSLSTLYVSTGSYPVLSTSSTNSRVKFSGTSATVNMRLRVTMCNDNGNHLCQAAPAYVPLMETDPTFSNNVVPAQAHAPNDADSMLDFTFNINDLSGLTVYKQSYEVIDPNKSSAKGSWYSTGTDSDTLGSQNANWSGAYDNDAASKFAMWDFSGGGSKAGQIGMLCFIPVGQVGKPSDPNHKPWDTLQFHSYNIASTDIPDWAILDLVAPSYGYPTSFASSTAGKINLNSRIFPDSSNYFKPPQRTAPLNALFCNMPKQSGNQAAAAIQNYQTDADHYFDYIGKICTIPGVADSTGMGSNVFDQEALLRNLAGLMTTQSNTFGIWGVAQTVKKVGTSSNYGTFQAGDKVTSERRFYAVVERYVWPGNDGVPGNGSIVSGSYSNVATGVTKPGAMPPTPVAATDQWAMIDGPQAPNLVTGYYGTGIVPYQQTSLASANNPAAAVMKYRIIYFTYIE